MASFISITRRLPRVVALTLSALACASSAGSVASADASSQQWRFISVDGSSTLREGIPFRLQNARSGQYYKYGQQYCGINLTSDGTSAAEWQAYSPYVSEGRAIGFDMPVALYNERAGRFVRYGVRSCGINLVWSSTQATPDYDWQMRGLSSTGTPLTSATPVMSTTARALFNRSNSSYVVYQDRAGVNLGWSNSLW